MNRGLTDDAFFRLLEENKRLILKICRVYCADPRDRDDLAQEIIYQLWRSAKTFDNDRKFSTWLYRVALNVAISHYRSRRRQPPTTVIAEADLHREEAPGIGGETEAQIEKLYAAISELKILDRAVILLHLDERPYKEIAEITGLTETNAATKVNRIKEKLKKILQPKWTDE